MFDPRLYRVGLVGVLVAVLVAAFSLENRPAPLSTTLAPDAFDGVGAARILDELATAHPDRRAGDAGDERIAGEIAQRLRGTLPDAEVRIERDEVRTRDGRRELATVIGTRPGRPGPGIVVVAHRDARERGSRAELSGTAALLELARVTSAGRLRRTITFVSTSGGSSGNAGALAAARRLSAEPVHAVLVLGDLASAQVRKPFVVPFSAGAGTAPLRLRRTVETAVRIEAGTEPGGARAPEQWARLAVPLTVSEQGPFGREGLPAVLLSASGERGPAGPRAALGDGRLETFGRAALRAVTALDAGPDIASGPERTVVTARKALPLWAVRLLGAALLLPVLLVVVDGLARLRRRGEHVGAWCGWVLAAAMPFALAGGIAVALCRTGLVPGVPPTPFLPEADATALGTLAALLLVLALGWVGLRPLVLRIAGEPPRPRDGYVADGAAVGVMLVVLGAALAMWVRNPHAAVLLAPALHLWLAALSPEMRLRGLPGVVVVLAGMLPVALIWAIHAASFDLGPLQTLWLGVLMVGGGAVGPFTWLLWALVAGAAVGAVLVAARRSPEDALPPPVDITVRGPLSYAGPGSLGGTESALRR